MYSSDKTKQQPSDSEAKQLGHAFRRLDFCNTWANGVHGGNANFKMTLQFDFLELFDHNLTHVCGLKPTWPNRTPHDDLAC